MSKYDELPVYKATYDLLLGIFKFTKDFNKEFKYTVGESLKKDTIELITLIYRANNKPVGFYGLELYLGVPKLNRSVIINKRI